MYQKIRDNLLPTPSKSHYTFNFRDMSKVVQGMLIPYFSNFKVHHN